jgi:glycosyltransferase involved in cell wall biosynthesis
VRDGETGLLVPTGDVPALVDALDRLVTDDGLRRGLAASAVRLIRSEHDAATNAGRLAAVACRVRAHPRS